MSVLPCYVKHVYYSKYHSPDIYQAPTVCPKLCQALEITVWKIIVYVSLELEVKLADKKMSFDSGVVTAQAFPMSAFYLLRVFN